MGLEDFVGVGKLRLETSRRSAHGRYKATAVVGGKWRKEGEELTRYHPVGLPVSPSLSWDVSTKRTFGDILNWFNCLVEMYLI
jgi:hypothetical protein